VASIKEVFNVIRDFLPIASYVARYQPPKDTDKISMGLIFQQTASRYPDRTAIIFEGQELSWSQFNTLTNRFAHGLKHLGVKRGDTVALLMENRIEMLASILALAKLGATAGLINTSLIGKPLIHCISITDSNKCLFGAELKQNIAAIKDQLTLSDQDYLWVQDSAFNKGGESVPAWAFDMSALLDSMPTQNLPETPKILAGEKACYIFTSGTTGLPKAAVIYHRRYMAAAQPYCKAGFRAKYTDRMYVCLPLYHITGLGPGVGSCLLSGATIVLRRRFSASKFWPEVQQHQTNLLVYVGELCRYLSMQEQCPQEKDNPLETMLGNGLRPDVWDQFRERFNVRRISEIYGSSEGNITFINVLNKDRTIGTSSASLILAQYDVDTDEILKDAQGKLLEATQGEPGLLLAMIDGKYRFDGYENQEATNSKVLENVRQQGDRWFNTGDIVKQIDVGFALGLPHYQFVDRVGDTFRWRAENVSTNEVGEILNTNEQIEISNVYGVEIPEVEGKAGMAALTLKPGKIFDPQQLSTFVERELPAYARPIFIRIQKEAETTVTFKLFKGALRKQSYHLNKVTDPLYVLKPRSNNYEPLDDNFYQQIISGHSGY
jgi:citronellyl-CoA synthetase